MNDYDMARALRRHNNPAIVEAVTQLVILRAWANANSDGWAYWPKPARAAAKLMELVDGDGTNKYSDWAERNVTPAMVRKALVPIKAFRTRQGADFVIIDPR
jgi:hypothetical protein